MAVAEVSERALEQFVRAVVERSGSRVRGPGPGFGWKCGEVGSLDNLASSASKAIWLSSFAGVVGLRERLCLRCRARGPCEPPPFASLALLARAGVPGAGGISVGV